MAESNENRNMSHRMFFKSVALVGLFLSVFSPLGGLRSAAALPFNQDMVGKQLVTGAVMRAKPAGSVPAASLDRQIKNRDAVANWTNPLQSDPTAAVKGERLFEVNCQVCHGVYKDGKHVASDLQARAGIPSLPLHLTRVTKDTPQKNDGYIFGYVYFSGGALMPPYGWKLANEEIWQIVSYIRELQKNVPVE